ncbi:MAG TPA: hypothetical protein VIM79_11275 [Niastella sp.]
MKKIIPALLLASVLFACKKDTNSDETPSAVSKVPVTFNIENFQVSQQDMSENGRVETDPTLAKFYKVFYMAFASDGKTASYIEQDSTNSRFGTISDSLLPGTYTVAVGAHNRTVPSSFTYITAKYASLASAEFYNVWARNTADFFYKKVQVTVNASGNQITDLSLNRIIGNLKVDLKDALPTSDPNGAITVNVLGVPQSYMINPDTVANRYSDVPMDRTSQTTWEYNIFGSNRPLTVMLSWRDKVTGAFQSKTITNVTVAPNKKTIISGYLYGVPTNVSAGDVFVRTNQNWSTDSTVISIN